MKIALGVHHFPPHHIGGAEWRAVRTARFLLEHGHDVKVVCVERIDDPSVRNTLRFVDEFYEEIPVRRLFFNIASAPNLLDFEYNNLWVGSHLQEWLASESFDLFHLISGYLLTASALRAAQAIRLPTVVTLTDFWFLCRHISMVRSGGQLSTLPISPQRCAQCLGEERHRYRWLGHLAPKIMEIYWEHRQDYVDYFTRRMAFLQQTLQKVNVAIAPSQFLLSMYEAAGFRAQTMLFMRQGLVYDEQPEPPPSHQPRPLRIGYLGQIIKIKGLHILIEAIQRTDAPFQVEVYGDLTARSDYSQELLHMAKNDPRIRFCGVAARTQIGEILRNLDVVVVPSLWYENSPNVILEAFAYGVPVIASNLGGMAELVKHEMNGLLFPMGDAPALAKTLMRLFCEPELASRLREGAMASRPPHLEEEMQQLLAVYERCVNEKQPAGLVSES